MIAHKTFSKHGGVTFKGMIKTQEEVRAEAQAFIASKIDPEDVVSITESALPSTWSNCLASVTVWYRKR
jgi:hypothetical protein